MVNIVSVSSFALVLVLAAMFVFRQYLLLATDWFLKGVFVLALIVATVGIFWNYPFQIGAEIILDKSGFKQSLEGTDTQVQKLNPSNWIDGFTRFISGEPQIEEYPAGYLVNNIYPGVLDTTTQVLRGATITTSIIILLFTIYFSYATYGASKVAKLEQRIHNLELSMQSHGE